MKKSKWMIWLGIGIFLCGLISYAIIPSNFTFTTTYYEIKDSRIENSIRIAHLTDLHNQEFGENNEKLINEVRGCKPDLIFITGDSVTMYDEEYETAVSLVEQLASIAPVYFSYGNHEIGYETTFGRDIGSLMEAAGATVLDDSYEDIVIEGEELRIGGIFGYGTPAEYLKTKEADPEECAFLSEFQDTDRFTMLLAHMPYAWIVNDGISKWNIDAVFSGHSHGGQAVLPFIGPVYAPDQGWFPDEVSGQFDSEDGSGCLIVSRGLGNSVKVPRVNNPLELVIVDVVGDKMTE